jgi:hypothetical protein
MEMNRSHAASVHLPRHLTEPLRPHRSFAASEAGSLDGQVLAPSRTRAAGCAKSTRQLAMHMDEIARACDLVQRVYILRDGKHVASMIPLEPRQRRMRRIGPRIAMPSPAEIVEVVQTRWVRSLQASPPPRAGLATTVHLCRGSAEPALGRQAGAGQDDDVVEGCHRTTGFSLDGNRTTIAGCEVGRTPGLTGVSNMKLRNFLLVSVAVILSLLSTAAMADNCTWAPQWKHLGNLCGR